MYQAYFDGSFNETTLCGGAGCVILWDGEVLEKHSIPLQDARSSNEAEMMAFQHCLSRFIHYRAKEIQVFGDHLNVIKGLETVRKKFYSIKEEENAARFLRNQEKVHPERTEAFRILERCFDSYQLVVIDGTFNALADFLAAEASGCFGWAGRQVRPRLNGYVPIPTQVEGGFRYFWRKELSE